MPVDYEKRLDDIRWENQYSDDLQNELWSIACALLKERDSIETVLSMFKQTMKEYVSVAGSSVAIRKAILKGLEDESGFDGGHHRCDLSDSDDGWCQTHGPGHCFTCETGVLDILENENPDAP